MRGPWSIAHKERRVLALRGRSAELLAGRGRGAGRLRRRCVLVPVPSRPGRRPGPAATTRRTRSPAAAAAAAPAGVRRRRPPRLLRSRGGVVDQAGLAPPSGPPTSAGSMLCPTAPLRRLAGRRGCAVVVCDDVLTTGRHRPRGPAGAGGRGSRGGRDRHRGRDPAAAPPVSGRTGFFGPPLSSVRPQRLASVHGVRSGPWLRRRDALDPRASRRQADASRRRNGPRKAPPGLVRGRRSRCGLEVSPASAPPSDAVTAGEGQ